jgi:hypothetical protein
MNTSWIHNLPPRPGRIRPELPGRPTVVNSRAKAEV